MNLTPFQTVIQQLSRFVAFVLESDAVCHGLGRTPLNLSYTNGSDH
jgi:hypothetical protein